MKKIPCLFEREFVNHQVANILDKVTPGCEWVLNGEGIATEKFDGTACMILEGKLYKRYDAKKGKQPPIGAIPCCDPDPITGHWPHWVLVDKNKKEDKWFAEAFERLENDSLYNDSYIIDATYELCGPHFQGNPYNLEEDTFYRHGLIELNDVPRTFEGIKQYLKDHYIEGIVFWKDKRGSEMCKIRRKDFGFSWKD